VAIAANTVTQIWAPIANGDNNGKVINIGAHDIWLGYDNSVSASTGFLLIGNQGADADGNTPGAFMDGLSTKLPLYAFAASGAASRVCYMKQGN
jgi:hypothetical protein